MTESPSKRQKVLHSDDSCKGANGRKSSSTSNLKFAVLHCAPGEKWADMHRHFQTAFEESGDEWDCFHVFEDGSLMPDPNAYKGYIITGSKFSAYDDLPWIRRLSKWIQDWYELHGRSTQQDAPKLFGSCFGCQMIGHSLGGSVCKIPDETHKILFEWGGTMIYKVEHVKPNESLRRFVKRLKHFPEDTDLPSELKFVESHGDHVDRLPPGSTLLASSPSCRNEIFSVHSNVLAVQAHPEWSAGEIERNLKEVMQENVREQRKKEFEEFRDFLQSDKSHHHLFMTIAKSWLRH